MGKIKVAVAQYDIGFFHHWSDYADKIHQWVSEAAGQGARLLVMPEYGSMELASLFGDAVYGDLRQQLSAMQGILPQWQALQIELARQFDVILISASFPVMRGDGKYVNRAFVHAPDGLLGVQDKLIMTRFENEQWFINAGSELNVIDTDIGRLGINICYDSEFPLIARQQVESGANIIVVPSCTDTEAGFHRVRIGCQARALENQCYVLHSPTFGRADWSPAVDVNTGRASVYTPVDTGFPCNGLLVDGSTTRPEWVYAELDLSLVAQVRAEGQVTNYLDWVHQEGLRVRGTDTPGSPTR